MSRPSTQLVVSIVLGFLAIIIGHISGEVHSWFFNTDDTSKASIFVKDQLSGLVWIGGVIIGTSIISAFFASGIEAFFKNKISPEIQKHVDRLSTELNQSATNTNKLLNEKLLENIIGTSSGELVRSQLKQIHRKAYGSHCGNDNGLYSAVNNKFSHFFEPEQPHRSDYNQTVTVIENDSDSIKWHEVCTYKIHTVAFDQDFDDVSERPIQYPIKFASTVKAAELEFQGEEPTYSLCITVDDTTLFDSKTDLEVKNQKVVPKDGIDWLTVNQNGNTFEISIERVHDVSKAWTDIKIVETSTIYDDYLISRRNEPTCGANININLPTGWNFELISFGHPNDWTIHQHPTNTLAAVTKTWLLPGITFFCKWKRPSQQKLDLDN